MKYVQIELENRFYFSSLPFGLYIVYQLKICVFDVCLYFNDLSNMVIYTLKNCPDSDNPDFGLNYLKF